MSADATALRNQVRRYGREVFTRASRTMLEETREAAPFRTGQTKASGGLARQSETATSFRATLSFPTPQAAYTDAGTRPHRIIARNASALRFFWPRAGRVVHFRSVKHPGTKATRWFRRQLTPLRWAIAVGSAANRVRSRT